MDVARELRVVDGGTGEEVGVRRSALCDVRDTVLDTVKCLLCSNVVELMYLVVVLSAYKVHAGLLESSVFIST